MAGLYDYLLNPQLQNSSLPQIQSVEALPVAKYNAPQMQPQQQQQQKQESPMDTAKNAKTIYDYFQTPATNVNASNTTGLFPESAATPSVAFDAAAPSAASTPLSSAAAGDVGGGLTGYNSATGAMSLNPALTGTGTTAASTGTGATAGGSTASGASALPYAGAGWFAAIAALGKNAVGHDWYQPSDILKGTAMAERWKNMDALKNFSGGLDRNLEGSGAFLGDSSRAISLDPREQFKGARDSVKDVAHSTKDLTGSIKNFSENNKLGSLLSGDWLRKLF